MSQYKKDWRKRNAEFLSLLACSSSSESETDNLPNDSTTTSGEDETNSPLHNNSSDCDTMTDISFNSSDESGSDSEECPAESLDDKKEALEQKLRKWACKHGVSRSSLKELLSILNEEGHALPSDPRTLLKTPRTTITQDLCEGQYIHFGIKDTMLKQLNVNPNYAEETEFLKIQINIDGVPLFKSSSDQLWPILGKIGDFSPFVIALYCGKTKPQSVDDFMREFLEEYRQLSHDGILYDGRKIDISIECFICDAPARSFIKCIKGHSGYNACERCQIKGEWKKRITYFSKNRHQLRTDEEFQQLKYLGTHQTRISPLTEYGIPCVSTFPLDYMHLVCLGVVRRLLVFLKCGPRMCRLSQHQINRISLGLVTISNCMPAEFARQPRSLSLLDRWKATEFRQFVLYTGAIVLKDVVDPDVYRHFLSLSVALSILLDSNAERRNGLINYARELLEFFVLKSRKIYGESFIVYNVHCCMHLPDDVEHFKCSLNAISAFPFENYLQTIKKHVRKGQNPLAQVINRTTEMENAGYITEPKKVIRKIRENLKDGCFLLDNDVYAFIVEEREDDCYDCKVIHIDRMTSFFTEPCDSKLLHIVFFKKDILSKSKRKVINRSRFERKVVCLPFGLGYVLIPLLHEDEH